MAKKRLQPTKIDTEAGPWIVRFVRGHVRLWIAIAVGIVVYLLVPANAPPSARFLLGWDAGVVFYLGVVIVTMARSSPSEIRYHSAMQDEGAFALLFLAVAAVLVSLGAIFAELVGSDRNAPGFGLHVTLAIMTVVLSWAFMHTIFTLRYAHEFYGAGHRAAGLKFPGDELPDYWDFAYFSFVIGMTFQVSDIAITHREIRHIVLAHAAMSFLFTVTIVSLAVNIASSLIGT